MQAFSTLYTTLDATTSTRDKLEALSAYFRGAPAQDAAWAAYFLAGGKPRQIIPTRLMRELAAKTAGLPDWLFEESYQSVGDLAETIAHVLPAPSRVSDIGLSEWIESRLLPLRGTDPTHMQATLRDFWDELDWGGRFLLNKLIGGGFRVGVSKQLVVRALAEVAGIDHKRLAHRMVGWTDAKRAPTAQRYLKLIAPVPNAVDDENGNALAVDATMELDEDEIGLPYPFFLAQSLQAADMSDVLGDIHDWQIEWKWDGIRAQCVRRKGRTWLWSRGEELITERFPDLIADADLLPDGVVLDGEILAWAKTSENTTDATDRPLPFARLQTRITRKTLTKKTLSDTPSAFLAYDILEKDGVDLRTHSQAERRAILADLFDKFNRDSTPLAHTAFRLSPLIVSENWHALRVLREESRTRGVEGMMLKKRDARYGVGRTRVSGDWWKWKIDPYTVDAVLLYAQHGHGRRASLYTDYTFGVWNAPAGDPARVLVPFTKAYSGLSDEEIKRVDTIIRQTTIDKFGPVRSVKPTLLFEIAFEGIARSPRHKSGIAVRFPRMLRWRLDKPIAEADTLDTLNALLDVAS